MKDKYIFVDMDGTIVNYHDRFYKVYSEAYIGIGKIPLSKENWIKTRKDGIHSIPEELREKIDPYFERNFESRDYLKYDITIPGMLNVIRSLQKEYLVKIVSFRSNNVNLLEQLDRIGIHNVETIIQGFAPGKILGEKANMIQRVIPNPSGWIIGDTEFEVIAGQRLGLKTISVTYGDRSPEFLKRYNPDFLIDKPEEILKIFQLVKPS